MTERSRGSWGTMGHVRRAGHCGAHDEDLLRRADAAGHRLVFVPVPSRVTRAGIEEAARLSGADQVAFVVAAAAPGHVQPCPQAACAGPLSVSAVVGCGGGGIPGPCSPSMDGLARRVIATGRPAFLHSSDEEPRNGTGAAGPDAEGTHLAVAGIPVAVRDAVRGVMLVACRCPARLDRGMVEALLRLSSHIGVALAVAHDRQCVEDVAAARERRKLARAMHDEFGQRLFTLSLAAREAHSSARAGRADLLARLVDVMHEAEATRNAFRATLADLSRAPASPGTVALSAREDAGALTDRTGIATHVLVLGEPWPVDAPCEDLLARTVREALRNVERHARATEVVITLAFLPHRGIELVVQDDGVGMSGGRSIDGIGTATLRDEYRRVGGDIRLTSTGGVGTTLRAGIPS